MDRDLYRIFTKMFPDEPSEEARRKRILDLVKTKLATPMSYGAEQMFVQTIENPQLLLANDVREFRDHIQQNGHSFQQPDLPKCSARAAKLRSEGNRLYAKKEYFNSLHKYNESICSAPNDSEDLGIGYANRSAVFYEQGEFILALANIALAKKHNYPVRLMPKLMAREANCKQAIDDLDPKPNSTMSFGSGWNHFLSDKICVRKLPVYNNSLVASQKIKAGDVILQERSLMVAVVRSQIFLRCNHCFSENLLHLIPCPNCVSAMFCNEKCLQDGQRMHRFECGFTGQLCKLKESWLGARMFFHGLALFDNDVNRMMAFCRTVKRSKCTFLDMDYSNYDPMKEFKIFLAVKQGQDSFLNCPIRLNAAIVQSLYLTVSSVRALITNRAQEDFMLQCFEEYALKTVFMSVQRKECCGMVTGVYPLASLCNHSCDPNTHALYRGGQMKLVALRPIRRDSQILISYGAHYTHEQPERKNQILNLGFHCICDVCDEQKHRKLLAKARHGMAIAPADKATITKLMTDTEFNKADRKNALQQFVQRYASLHPREDFASIVRMHGDYLADAYMLEMDAAMRAKIAG